MGECQECGKPFYGSRCGQKFCSKPCREKAWKLKHPINKELFARVCVACGKGFKTSDHRKIFCEPKCHTAHHNAQRPSTKEMDRECPICNTLFKPQQRRGVGRTCCSDYCTYVWRHGEAAAMRARDRVRKQSSKTQATYMRKWRKENPDAAKNADLLKEYGITLEQYHVMHDGQGGLCAICRQPETIIDRKTGKLRMLSVDHHHASGVIRKLLCTRCNQGIGNFRESLEFLKQAANYLDPSTG